MLIRNLRNVSLLLFLAILPAVSQQARKPEEPYVGEGIKQDLDQARLSALNALAQQIQVFLSASLHTTQTETGSSYSASSTSDVVARSMLLLRDVREEILRDPDGAYRVRKSVSRDAVDRMFALRRQRIVEELTISERELLAGLRSGAVDIGSVLKHAYRAYLHGRLYPDTLSFLFHYAADGINDARYTNATDGAAHVIETVVKGVSVAAVTRVKDESTVWKCSASYGGVPVRGGKYSYNDGMGESFDEISKGALTLWLNVPSKEKRSRDVDLHLEYRYPDEMDDQLRMADSMEAGSFPRDVVTVTLPGGVVAVDEGAPATSPTSVPAAPGRAVSASSVPPILQPLLAPQIELRVVLRLLNDLVRQGKVMAARRAAFEKPEGLYVAVLSDKGLEDLLRYHDGKLHRAVTDEVRDLSGYVGRHVIWIEVLRN